MTKPHKHNQRCKKKQTHGRKKAPSDKPKRPLSAYNIFFRSERERILLQALLNEPHNTASSGCFLPQSEITAKLKAGKDRPHRKTHGKVGFVDLVQKVSAKWNSLPEVEKDTYKREAQEEQVRYQKELQDWKESSMQKLHESQEVQPKNEETASKKDLVGIEGKDDTNRFTTSETLAPIKDEIIHQGQQGSSSMSISHSTMMLAPTQQTPPHTTSFEVGSPPPSRPVQLPATIGSNIAPYCQLQQNQNENSIGIVSTWQQKQPSSSANRLPIASIYEPFPLRMNSTHSSSIRHSRSSKNDSSYFDILSRELDDECFGLLREAFLGKRKIGS